MAIKTQLSRFLILLVGLAPTLLSAQTDNFDSFGASNMTSIFSTGLGITNPFSGSTIGGTARCNFFLSPKISLGAQLFYTNNGDANNTISNSSNLNNKPGYLAMGNITGTYYLIGENASGKKGVYLSLGLGYTNAFQSFSQSGAPGNQTNQWGFGYDALYKDQYLSITGGIGGDYKLYHGRIFAELNGMTSIYGNDIYTQSGVSGSAYILNNKYKIDPSDFGKFGALLFSVGYNYFF